MRTGQRAELPHKTRQGSTEAVRFSDGMIVTAEDLGAAQRYPVSLLRTVLRAYFGCGVICGLDLVLRDKAPWQVTVTPGVAVDCAGLPLELCVPIDLDLSREACSYQSIPPIVHILIRRATSDEPADTPCGCHSDLDDNRFECRRTREGVLLQAFDDESLKALTAKVCSHDPKKSACSIWSAGSSCGSDDSWLLLGTLSLSEKGIVPIPDLSTRPRATPIAAICGDIERRLSDLEKAKAAAGVAAPSSSEPAKS